jgi:anti-anti-sigma factor
MNYVKKEKDGQGVLTIRGPLTIYQTGELREVLLSLFIQNKGLVIDISPVTDCDTIGLQLLISTRKKARKENKMLVITGKSDAVKAAADRAGILWDSIMDIPE